MLVLFVTVDCGCCFIFISFSKVLLSISLILIRYWKLAIFYLGSVWNPESTREKKKNAKKNDFITFGFTVENI